MATWKKILVDGDTVGDYRILADEAARDSIAASERKQGYLAYLNSEKQLCVYNSSETGDTPWQLNSNWLQIPHTTSDYDAITFDTFAESADNKYHFQLYDVDNDVYKKFDVTALSGVITQLLAQALIDGGVGSLGTYTAAGSSILGDLNGDGIVNNTDLLILLANFGAGNTAGFSVDYETLFVSNGPPVSMLTGVASYNATDLVTLPFDAADITQSSTGFTSGFNDSSDYFVIEDGDNFTVYTNLIAATNGSFDFDIDFLCSNTLSSPDFVVIQLDFWFTNSATQVGSIHSVYFGNASGNSMFIVTAGAENETHSLSYNFKTIIANAAPAYDSASPSFDGMAFKLKALSVNGNIDSIQIKSGSKLDFSN